MISWPDPDAPFGSPCMPYHILQPEPSQDTQDTHRNIPRQHSAYNGCKKEKHRLEQEWKRLRGEKKRLEKRLEKKCENLQESNSQLEQRCSQLEQRRSQLQNERDTLHRDKKNLQCQYNDLMKRFWGVETERDYFKMRLSKMASDKMREDNPAVEDLNDPRRPTALTTKWESLFRCGEYWTAYEKIASETDEATAALSLHGICKTMYEVTKTFVEDLMEALKAEVRLEQSETHLQAWNVERFLPRKDLESLLPCLRGVCAGDSEGSHSAWKHNRVIAQLLRSRHPPASLMEEVDGAFLEKDMELKCFKKFADELQELIYYMRTQEIPMVVDFSCDVGSIFNPSLYEAGSNKTVTDSKSMMVRCVLRPAVLRHESGPLLSKGEVEITPRFRSWATQCEMPETEPGKEESVEKETAILARDGHQLNIIDPQYLTSLLKMERNTSTTTTGENEGSSEMITDGKLMETNNQKSCISEESEQRGDLDSLQVSGTTSERERDLPLAHDVPLKSTSSKNDKPNSRVGSCLNTQNVLDNNETDKLGNPTEDTQTTPEKETLGHLVPDSWDMPNASVRGSLHESKSDEEEQKETQMDSSAADTFPAENRMLPQEKIPPAQDVKVDHTLTSDAKQTAQSPSLLIGNSSPGSSESTDPCLPSPEHHQEAGMVIEPASSWVQWSEPESVQEEGSSLDVCLPSYHLPREKNSDDALLHVSTDMKAQNDSGEFLHLSPDLPPAGGGAVDESSNLCQVSHQNSSSHGEHPAAPLHPSPDKVPSSGEILSQASSMGAVNPSACIPASRSHDDRNHADEITSKLTSAEELEGNLENCMKVPSLDSDNLLAAESYHEAVMKDTDDTNNSQDNTNCGDEICKELDKEKLVSSLCLQTDMIRKMTPRDSSAEELMELA